jgi:hypothetical protein
LHLRDYLLRNDWLNFIGSGYNADSITSITDFHKKLLL